jgi:hypothetical protein
MASRAALPSSMQLLTSCSDGRSRFVPHRCS